MKVKITTFAKYLYVKKYRYLKLNYKRIYDSIVNNRIKNKYEGYTESHHILPKSLGGSDEKTNLVDLTAREHYICHLLLTKMFDKDTPEYFKMLKAYNMMCNAKSNQERDYKINSRLYESLRKDFSKALSICQLGENNNQYGTIWIYSNKLRKSKKVKKDYVLTGDWQLGRVMNFDYLDRVCKKCGVNLNCKSNKELKQNCSHCSKKTTESKKKKLQVNNSCKKCICDGVEYISVGEASRLLGVHAETLRMRIKSKNYEKYYYL